MNSFSLVRADDDATQGSALLKKEDGVRISTFSLPFASSRTSIVSSVRLRRCEGLPRSDGNGRAQRASRRRRWEDISSRAPLQTIYSISQYK